MKRCLIVFVLMIGLASGMYAFPFANYGNIRVPEGYVMPHTMTKITLMNYFHPENNRKDDDIAYNWGTALNIGLFNHGELGVVMTGDEIFYAHVKAKILRESVGLPDLAVGIDNFFSDVGEKKIRYKPGEMIDSGNYRRNSMYIAVSKTALLGGMPFVGDLPARFTAGAGTNRFIGTVELSKKFSGVFLAAQIEPIQNVSFIGEMDGHNVNIAAEYRYKNVSGTLMLYKIEEWDRRDPKFGISLSYLFDKYVPEDMRAGFTPGIGATQLYDARDSSSLDELQRIRRQRERAEQELLEIKRLLQD